MIEVLTDYQLWASFLSLTALEVVLGIDNVVFIALAVGHLPKHEQQKARLYGLGLALIFRIIMLGAIVWIMGLKQPWLNIFGMEFSGKDILMFAGGVFLLYKATTSIHEEVTGEIKAEYKMKTSSFFITILQIVVIDIIFSFDSVMTAIGLTEYIYVIIAAMTVAMIVMLVSSGYIAQFIAKHPTIKMLALSFVMMVGIFLCAEGLGFHVPKGYIYFGMAFSLSVETLNIFVRKKSTKKKYI